jgi:murein hydrolase activator
VRVSGFLAATLLVVLSSPAGTTGPVAAGQVPAGAAADASARAAARIRALQREADSLAGQAKSLLVDLRKLEVERDLRAEEARKLDAEVEAVARQVDDTARQISSLEGAIAAARPGLNARLVDVYKLGRPGYARVLLGIGNLRDVGRATRMITALARIDQHRVAEFTASVARLGAARAALDQQSIHLRGLQADARQAADLAARAAAAREELVRQIDARRDLNAQMVGELEQARDRLQRTVAALPGAAAPEPAVLPLKPFRGALEWPVPGRVLSRFGQQRNPRFGTTTDQSGVEIESVDGAPVRAVHEGRVAYADVFAGLGQLVIVDHGNLAFTLYGYLGSIAVTRGMAVTGGQVIAAAGRGPAGNSAVYFELRIDGKPVDPVEWMKAK